VDLTLRPYRPADRDPVWRVHDRALRASNLDYDPEYNRYLRHVRRSFVGAGGQFFVGTLPADAFDGDYPGLRDDDGRRVVAIGGYQPLDSLPSEDHPPAFDGVSDRTARVRSVAVLPACQGRGIGSRLVDRVESDAREAGFGTLVLSSVASMSGARAFWRARGYERLRETPVSGTDSVWFRTDC
jgi:ribosomal protein S18 acetylase RimI-like enzyme